MSTIAPCLTDPRNGTLYTRPGLASAYNALRPGGVLSIWSADLNNAFRQRLASTGFRVTEARVRSGANGGARHTIWIGQVNRRVTGPRSARPERSRGHRQDAG